MPWLASDWKISEDGFVYTYHLVKNAKWHDGQPLTAGDVVFTFEYYRDHAPADMSLYVDGSYIVASAKAIDTYTVEITLKKRYVVAFTALGYARILPKHIWENVSDPLIFETEKATIGSGPYKLESYNPTQGTYRFVENEDFWGPELTATAIEWIPVGDEVMAFENGDLDLFNVSADLLNRYKKDSHCEVISTYSWHSYRLMFNMKNSPELQNLKVRQAIAYAIDDKELIQKVGRGQAVESSKGYVPSQNAWCNPDVESYSYNQEKAKQLL